MGGHRETVCNHPTLFIGITYCVYRDDEICYLNVYMCVCVCVHEEKYVNANVLYFDLK